MKAKAIGGRALVVTLVALAACKKQGSPAVVADALDREVDHATNLVLASCKPGHEATAALRASTTTAAYELSFRDLAACAADARCDTPKPSADATAALRELSPEARRFLDDGVTATATTLASASDERRGKLRAALERSRDAMQSALALSKLCGNPARISEVPAAMSKVNDHRAASRSATKGLRDGG